MGWFHRHDPRVRDELRAHRDRLIEDYLASGLDRAAAERRAFLEFGNTAQLEEAVRDARGAWFADFAADIRYAWRILRKSPAFALAAIASLALGIGGNTAIFSVMDAALWKSLPVREPGRLIELLTNRGGRPFNAFSHPALLYFRDHATTVEGVFASSTSRFYSSVDASAPEAAMGQFVTGDYFTQLGVAARIGRTIESSDDRPSAELVAVLGDAYWRRRFAADPLVVGRRLTIDDHAFTIVGVTSPSFKGTQVGTVPEFWIPLAAEPQLRNQSWLGKPGPKWLQILARLKTGVDEAAAAAELKAMFQAGVIETEIVLQARDKGGIPPDQIRSWRLDVVPARTGVTGVRQRYRQPLIVVMAVSAMVLLMACVNVANLLLARARARRHEIALRLSLGAGRGRIVRQLLTESVLLSSVGAMLGVGVADLFSRYLLSILATGRQPLTLDTGPDLRVLAFAATLAVVTGLLFGVVPSWRAASDARSGQLIGGGRVQGSRERRRLRRVLIASQVALSVILLAGAGLFLRSLHNLRSIDTGFDASAVLVMSTDASRSKLPAESVRAAFREMLTRLAAIPGVQSASVSDVTPIEGGGTMRTLDISDAAGVTRTGRDLHLLWVGPSYFSAMKLPIYAGRDFTWEDTPKSPRVAIVNQTLARRYFGNASPLGGVIEKDGGAFQIVAVVADAKYLELRDAVPPTLYLHAFQQDRTSGQFVIRTAGNPRAVEAAARETVRAVAPSFVVGSVRTLEQQVDASITAERLLGVLSGFFAVLGMLLASVGLYGVMAYGVSQRRAEIGIRMALGASRLDVVALVIREALLVTGAGIIAGIAGSRLLAGIVRSLLFGLDPGDTLTFAAVIILILATSLASAYLPSRRASRIDPAEALRAE